MQLQHDMSAVPAFARAVYSKSIKSFPVRTVEVLIQLVVFVRVGHVQCINAHTGLCSVGFTMSAFVERTERTSSLSRRAP